MAFRAILVEERAVYGAIYPVVLTAIVGVPNYVVFKCVLRDKIFSYLCTPETTRNTAYYGICFEEGVFATCGYNPLILR
jgi:hypothetical protein